MFRIIVCLVVYHSIKVVLLSSVLCLFKTRAPHFSRSLNLNGIYFGCKKSIWPFLIGRIWGGVCMVFSRNSPKNLIITVSRTMLFTSEAGGSRTQKTRIAAVNAVRQCAHNQKLKILTNTSRTHWKSARAFTSCTATKPNPNKDINDWTAKNTT